MTSRDGILSSIRKHKVQPVELPGAEGPWIQYADRYSQFAAMLASVGGTCIRAVNVAQINLELAQLPAYLAAKTVCSTVNGVGTPNIDLAAIEDPHDLESVDFAVLPGRFAVAENGAVWVSETDVPHRAIYFIVQHLALVVPAEAVVNNMHEAYQVLCERARESAGDAWFVQPGFGTFISGPSKTADIEQSLVIGAHGPRSMTVFLLG